MIRAGITPKRYTKQQLVSECLRLETALHQANSLRAAAAVKAELTKRSLMGDLNVWKLECARLRAGAVSGVPGCSCMLDNCTCWLARVRGMYETGGGL